MRLLLSSVAFWMKEFQMDGFMVQGVGEMLLGGKGQEAPADIEALVLLMLANDLARYIYKDAVTLAEDVSNYVYSVGVSLNTADFMPINPGWWTRVRFQSSASRLGRSQRLD
jgi:1,4-alpha-glucan branching enzyme